MKDFSKHLSKQIGENLLVAELGRRGIIATTFTGNMPEIDIIAYKNKKSISIQVKSSKKGNITVDAKNYLEIEFRKNVQLILNKRDDIDKNLIFVIVNIGDNLGEDEFYICRQSDIQNIIYLNHKSHLEKYNGVRPKKPESTHSIYSINDLYNYKNKWEIIEDSFL